MSNCNNLFQQFEQAITPSSTKIEKLIVSRKKLEEEIIRYFKEKAGYKVPDFLIQGSYKMKTMIIKKDGTYDVDLGVYFKEKPNVNCTTVMSHVQEAVKNITTGGAQHRERCIRVIYAGDYNIDIPVYYQGLFDAKAKMAIKGSDWRNDDPEEMLNWFSRKKDSKGQLLLIVKCLKRWASERGFKMPSGIALTVWASERLILSDGRDDIAFSKTINSILGLFGWNVSCKCPVQPFDDLLDNLDDNQKTKFKDALKSFKEDAELALNEPNQLKASKIWRKHFGNLFPEGKDSSL